MARKRSIGLTAEERSPDQYRAMLTRELGAPTFGRPLQIESGPAGAGGLLSRPLALFCFALLAFIAVLTVKLWREGALDFMFGSKSAQVEPGRRGWMLGDKRPPPPLDKSATTDPDYTPPPAQAAPPPAADSESAAAPTAGE